MNVLELRSWVVSSLYVQLLAEKFNPNFCTAKLSLTLLLSNWIRTINACRRPQQKTNPITQIFTFRTAAFRQQMVIRLYKRIAEIYSHDLIRMAASLELFPLNVAKFTLKR